MVTSVFVSGWLAGHFLTPPQTVTGDRADQIVKYCTPAGAGNGNDIPAPFNGWVPEEYKNGTYVVYVCKVR